MLGICGVVFIVIGGITLAGSSTMFGQIAGLILWVIAALFIVGQAIIGALAREARSLGQALAMHAEATNKPAGIIYFTPALICKAFLIAHNILDSHSVLA